MQLKMIMLYVLNVLGFSGWVGISPIHEEFISSTNES